MPAISAATTCPAVDVYHATRGRSSAGRRHRPVGRGPWSLRGGRLGRLILGFAISLTAVGCAAASGNDAAGTNHPTSGPAASAPDPAGHGTGSSQHTPIRVLASTDVYAAIARQIGGDAITVTAILDRPDADPHSFEATPRTALEVSQAALMIVNGGGYDDFTTHLLAVANPKPEVIDAVEVSGLDAAGSDVNSADFNEHVFYDLPAMAALGTRIAERLARIDPSAAGTFSRNAAAFTTALDGLQSRATAISATQPHVKAVVTEPVADYLLTAAGITDVTPHGFAQAIENETDPSVKDTAAVESLLASGSVRLLVYNVQTTGPVTDRVKAAAIAAGVPVVGVSETLPAGVPDYPSMIGAVLAAIDHALTTV
ncbi:MAG: zinc ABC transporter substrate-binding protein [Jatrophihabitantaceae bacterium]